MKCCNTLVALKVIILYTTLYCTKNVRAWSIPGTSLFRERFGDWINAPPSRESGGGIMNIGPSRSSGSNYLDYLERLSNPLSEDFAPNFRRNYAYFMLVFTLLVFYGIAGKFRNKWVAKRWANTVMPVLEDYFAFIEREPTPLDVKSWNEFEMYVSGRTSCRSMLIKLNLVKRQCFWHETFFMLLSPVKDMVTFEVHFDTLDSFMFAMCKKLKNKEFIAMYQHLVLFSSLYEGKELPEAYRAYMNSTDRTLSHLPNYVLHQFQPFMEYLEYFYVSDVVWSDSYLSTKPVMSVCFRLRKQKDEVESLIKAVVNVVDYCKNFALTPKQREAILKERSELQAVYSKLNKKDKDESDDEKEVTPEKAKKLEERMAKRSKPITNIKIKKAK